MNIIEICVTIRFLHTVTLITITLCIMSLLICMGWLCILFSLFVCYIMFQGDRGEKGDKGEPVSIFGVLVRWLIVSLRVIQSV